MAITGDIKYPFNGEAKGENIDGREGRTLIYALDFKTSAPFQDAARLHRLSGQTLLHPFKVITDADKTVANVWNHLVYGTVINEVEIRLFYNPEGTIENHTKFTLKQVRPVSCRWMQHDSEVENGRDRNLECRAMLEFTAESYVVDYLVGGTQSYQYDWTA